MNNCIKCGCEDANPSLPPCPSPEACPDSQPCAEAFDAQCVKFTLPNIICNETIVVAQDDSISDALIGIVSYFCNHGSDGIQSVTGLNTNNADPQNPVVRISVDGITITGLGTPASPLVASGGIAGSGQNNYVARWTPDGNTLGYGTIQDNGLTAGVNGLVSTIDFVVGGTTGSSYAFLAEVNAGSIAAIKGQAVDPSATVNTAIAAWATNTSTGGAIGGNFNVNGFTTGTGDAIGIKVLSEGTLATKYAVQLQDGTEGVGKVLTCMSTDGKANWVTPATGIAGSGTTDYVARWTPDGNTLGKGLIRDNGSNISIDSGFVSNVKVFIVSDEPFGVITEQTVQGIAGTFNAPVAGTGQNLGIQGRASMSTTSNIGGEFLATGTGTDIAIGGSFSAASGASNYSLKLQDGTEGIGKVLTSVTADGKANWADANPQKFITYPADFPSSNYTLTSADNGYSIVVINGSTAVTITVPTALVAKMQVGFIQDGTGDVTFTPSSTLLKNAISGYKIKGQYDQAYLEQGSATNIYYLLGNTKV